MLSCIFFRTNVLYKIRQLLFSVPYNVDFSEIFDTYGHTLTKRAIYIFFVVCLPVFMIHTMIQRLDTILGMFSHLFFPNNNLSQGKEHATGCPRPVGAALAGHLTGRRNHTVLPV